MLDCEIGLAGPDPEGTAQIPAASIARVEREGTVDQPDHGADILAESSQHEGGVGKDARVVLSLLERLPSKLDGPAAGYLRLRGPAIKKEPQVAHRGPGECRPGKLIDRHHLVQELPRPL